MADSEFWRNLAEQFRTLPGAGTLRADWTYQIRSGAPSEWRFSGDASLCIQFQALARRGAAALPKVEIPDLLVAWLEVLKAFNPQLASSSYYVETSAGGTEGPHYLVGSLHPVCLISADYCNRLESEAVQKEFEEKQRSDPKNWSQFRQQYEAFKSIRELHNEPAERIPEEFVRNAIARIHNIKPEEVTPQQINFEVAGLLSSTKRRIELIPSTARQESPPVAEEKHVYVGMETTRILETPEPVQTSAANETIAGQLQRLREECRWTIPDLAEATGLSDRQVARHLSGKFKPLPRNISAYERAFCKRLQRKIVINKMS